MRIGCEQRMFLEARIANPVLNGEQYCLQPSCTGFGSCHEEDISVTSLEVFLECDNSRHVPRSDPATLVQMEVSWNPAFFFRQRRYDVPAFFAQFMMIFLQILGRRRKRWWWRLMCVHGGQNWELGCVVLSISYRSISAFVFTADTLKWIYRDEKANLKIDR